MIQERILPPLSHSLALINFPLTVTTLRAYNVPHAV